MDEAGKAIPGSVVALGSADSFALGVVAAVDGVLWAKEAGAEKAGEFYAVHKERPFYGELVDYMSSGPIVAAILEKENAVEDFRTLIGATNPADAAEGTIRKLYATSMGENAVHGSDSDENAAIEGEFHFSATEIV